MTVMAMMKNEAGAQKNNQAAKERNGEEQEHGDDYDGDMMLMLCR